MNCPECGGDTLVPESRPDPSGYVWRMRKCKVCGHRFATTETLAALPRPKGKNLHLKPKRYWQSASQEHIRRQRQAASIAKPIAKPEPETEPVLPPRPTFVERLKARQRESDI